VLWTFPLSDCVHFPLASIASCRICPRDAMLARVLAMSVSVCVCHKSVFYRMDGMNNLVLAWGFLSTSPILRFKEIRVSTK